MDGTGAMSQKPRWKPEPYSLRDGFANLKEGGLSFVRRRPKTFVALMLLLVFLLVSLRHDAQYLLLLCRIYFGGLIMAAALLYILWRTLRPLSARWRALGGVLAAMVLALVLVGGKNAHTYVSQYLRYETLANVVDADKPLISAQERILPLRAVHTLARDRMNRPEIPSSPDLVRNGESSCWTMAIQPNKFLGRLTYPIEQAMCIPATDPSPDIGHSIVNVHFATGENLFLGQNIDTCTRRAFGPWQNFNYDVGNVMLLPDDSGNMVQVVSLIKWTGILFPWPQFGGVQLIRQTTPSPWYVEWFFEHPKRFLFGCGEWISPQDIAKHPFLLRQNIVPEDVSRFTAESFRFQGGTNAFARFVAPMPWSREGDIMIADSPNDKNPQPFVLYFKTDAHDPGKLYHTFLLETRDVDTHGLSATVWYPADGVGPVYAYRHAARGEHIIGVTAVPDRVMASKRNYQWGPNTVVEARPYIHDIADSSGNVERRYGYLTTLVTFTAKKESEGGEVRLMPGGTPEIAITDSSRDQVVWVDPYHPELWDSVLQKELGPWWAKH